jgi:hypothetical protein
LRFVSLLVVFAVLSGFALAAGNGHFHGSVILEWVDDTPFIASMRLVEKFSFEQADGKSWVVPAGTTVDGRFAPPLFTKLMGHPFDGGFRKSAIVYDYVAKDMTQPWREAQRMFYEASIVEGVLPIEAKVMFMLMNAEGSRWVERRSSSCFNSCHSGASDLSWRPLVDDAQVIALVSWVREGDPSLDEIEQRVDDTLLHRGPHIFAYVR